MTWDPSRAWTLLKKTVKEIELKCVILPSLSTSDTISWPTLERKFPDNFKQTGSIFKSKLTSKEIQVSTAATTLSFSLLEGNIFFLFPLFWHKSKTSKLPMQKNPSSFSFSAARAINKHTSSYLLSITVLSFSFFLPCRYRKTTFRPSYIFHLS